MPTKLPRLMVSITAEQNDLLGRLGALQGRSKASYIRELLDGAEPLLTSLLGAMKAHLATIEGQPVAVRDVVARVLTGTFGTDQLDLVEEITRIASEEEAERTAPSVQAREDRTATPRIVTRGSASAAHEPKGGSKRRRKAPRRG